ncbi:hypothetical protein X758_32145 [Mesorhizobium sp. LSHC416B00]|nr:hypothetical protein X761_32460 [Mesorhizobium sp. LSHC424B00]ESX64190.1 hypothetical protein X758_32145 [Mesorhizobium sp. LSHC416B00]
MRTYSVDSDLSFKIVEQPGIGMVRVLQQIGDDEELLYLAESREAAALCWPRPGTAMRVLKTSPLTKSAPTSSRGGRRRNTCTHGHQPRPAGRGSETNAGPPFF